jgi:hypothetical protein
VGFLKITFITPQKPTVQKHTLLRYEKKSLSELLLVAIILWIKELPEYPYQQEAVFPLRSRDK